MQQDMNCYGQVYPAYQVGTPSFTSSDLSICNPGNTGTTTGFGPGEAIINAGWTADAWFFSPTGVCDYTPTEVLRDAICEVLLAADRLKVVSDTGQVALAACPTIFTRQIIYQVIDTNGAAVNRTLRVKEAFQNQSTNTCGNGQPTASSCGPTNSAGQIADTLSITCGGQSGAQSNPSCGFTQTQTISTCAPSVIRELSFASHSIKANQVLVNTTTQFPLGTILPK